MSVEIIITEQGADVVASASGSIDLTDLTYHGVGVLPYDYGHYIFSGAANFVLGPGMVYDYYSHIDGPSYFGRGNVTVAWTNTGSGLLAIGDGYLGVDYGYISGAPFTAGSLYQNETLDSLFLTPGTSYLYTWGAGAHADSLTLRVGDSVATPEPATWMLLLLGFVVLGRLTWKRYSSSAA